MAAYENHLNRREVLKSIGLGAALGLGGRVFAAGEASERTGRAPGKRGRRLYEKVTTPARVSLVKGNERREIVYQALKKIEEEVLASIGGRKILIKPNFVWTDIPLCATHVDAVRAILDFLKPHHKGQIMIGESSAMKKPTTDGFKNYGYVALEKEYDVKLVDLNKTAYEYRYVFGQDHDPLPVRIISTFLDPDVYIISAARMKTHDRVVVTLSLKNVLLAAPLNDYDKNDKWVMHTGPQAVNTVLHFNMFHLAQEIYPDLAVIDGFEGMEGNGPMFGTPFDSRVALASLDPLAADTVGTTVMGFDPKRIMYLRAMNAAGMGQGDMDRINILGTPLSECQYKFKPNQIMAELYKF